MTKGNVGSLLVFDPSKLDLSKGVDELQHASGEAVVGLVTERGALLRPREALVCRSRRALFKSLI